MTTVSTPQLVTAACRAGVVGAFPATNCRSPEELAEWFDSIAAESQGLPAERPIMRLAVNLITHVSNADLSKQLERIGPDRVG